MHSIEIVPSAAALIQSLRGFGYSPETALADLVDNSIAAGASSIDIDLAWHDGAPTACVLDNGRGFDRSELTKAMCFGGEGPAAERSPEDLGRFGLGLKTASLSQCRRVTVAGRRNGLAVALLWDIDEVVSSGRWQALIPDALPKSSLVNHFEQQSQGALVIWENFDTIGGLFGLDKDTFYLRVENIRGYLGMVFHRFIDGDARRIRIRVNERPVRPWDPFLHDHPATITMQTERLQDRGVALFVRPYVLPHHDRFANETEYEWAGGLGGWGERQGFYVYRGKRLVVAGGWLGLGGTRAWTREESSRLARVAIDLPIGADASWRIDVKKSMARPPGVLRQRLTVLADACRQKAREVFAWRGGSSRVRRTDAVREVLWVVSERGGRFRYKINRAHPAVKAIAHRLGSIELIEGLLSLVEHSVPIERIWLDVSDSDAVADRSLDACEIDELACRLVAIVSELTNNQSSTEQIDQLLKHLPVDSTALRQAVLLALENKQ